MNEFKLNNGAVLIARDETSGIVLAKFRGVEYVTWDTNENGDAFWGHYFGDNIGAAAKDYETRRR